MRFRISMIMPALLAMLGVGTGVAQRAPLIEQPLPLAPNLTLRMAEVVIPPSRDGPTSTASQAGHRHPGSTYVYVISGRVASRLGDGAEVIYGQGEAWAERPGEAHYVVNADRDMPARLLVVFVVPRGTSRLSEPTTPQRMR